MTLNHKLGVLAATVVFALALGSPAEARRLTKENCPTGQVENPITAICEGPYRGTFMYVMPGGDSWEGHHWGRWHRWHHCRHLGEWRRHHHWKHHHWMH